VQIAFDGADVLSVSLADGRYTQVREELTIVAEAVVGDLHVARVGDRLELTSAAPPAALRLHGALLGAVERIVANGRELRRSGANRDTVVLAAPEWGVPRSQGEPGSQQQCAG
jgi:hypothetical protein